MIKKPRLAFKFRLKRIVARPFVRLFFYLSRKNSIFLKIGFLAKLRRRFAPTKEEMRQDIIASHGENVNACIRELIYFENMWRKIMPPDPLPLDEEI